MTLFNQPQKLNRGKLILTEMKTFITLLLLIITLNCNAQYGNSKELTSDSPEMLIPISIIATTMITVDIMLKDTNKYDEITTSTVAVTGIVTSIMSYKLIQILKANPSKIIRKKRIKRLSRL